MSTPNFDAIRDDLADCGFVLTVCVGAFPAGVAGKTVDYYAFREGWDAFRDNDGSLTFARLRDGELKLMTTTPSGVVMSEATFMSDPLGARMFATVAAMRP